MSARNIHFMLIIDVQLLTFKEEKWYNMLNYVSGCYYHALDEAVCPITCSITGIKNKKWYEAKSEQGRSRKKKEFIDSLGTSFIELYKCQCRHTFLLEMQKCMILF